MGKTGFDLKQKEQVAECGFEIAGQTWALATCKQSNLFSSSSAPPTSLYVPSNKKSSMRKAEISKPAWLEFKSRSCHLLTSESLNFSDLFHHLWSGEHFPNQRDYEDSTWCQPCPLSLALHRSFLVFPHHSQPTPSKPCPVSRKHTPPPQLWLTGVQGGVCLDHTVYVP